MPPGCDVVECCLAGVGGAGRLAAVTLVASASFGGAEPRPMTEGVRVLGLEVVGWHTPTKFSVARIAVPRSRSQPGNRSSTRPRGSRTTRSGVRRVAAHAVGRRAEGPGHSARAIRPCARRVVARHSCRLSREATDPCTAAIATGRVPPGRRSGGLEAVGAGGAGSRRRQYRNRRAGYTRRGGP